VSSRRQERVVGVGLVLLGAFFGYVLLAWLSGR
jgi:hypothetical protein